MPESVNPIAQQLAEQLRDVHLPVGVSWWPLALGWWLVLFFVVSATLILSAVLFRKWRSNQYRKTAQRKLNDAYTLWQKYGDKSDYLNSANEILKRAMLSLSQHSAVSSSGSIWVASLNHMAKMPLSDATQNALAYECYKAAPSIDIEALNADVVSWIKTHRGSTKLSNDVRAQHKITPHA